MSFKLEGRDDPECVRDILRERSEGVNKSVREEGRNSSKSSSAERISRSAETLTSIAGLVPCAGTSAFHAWLCVCPREEGTPGAGPRRFLDSVSNDVCA